MKSKSSSLGGKWKAKGLYRVFLALHFRTWKITAPRKDERYKPENDAISENWRAPFIRFGIPRSSILVLCKLLVPSQENPMEFSFFGFFCLFWRWFWNFQGWKIFSRRPLRMVQRLHALSSSTSTTHEFPFFCNIYFLYSDICPFWASNFSLNL